ncbi:hypothetical protein AJ80_08793 [Polytolypa hystricis UAMH7299]|uniref:Uncharacterized protein n=1 Tax=Polytolypa hystricis (strain UAMH7299) TaxID=1447883 RepID=A0A2B7X216_POLH7|nr:hypothetical protein AJ80_08793 [Polytolypa hystricis UAMH7299]
MKHITLFLSLGGLLPSTFALPQPFARRSEQCNRNDVGIYTKANWQAKDVDSWFTVWELKLLAQSVAAMDWESVKYDETLAAQYGLGQTFDCTLNNECERPLCNKLIGNEPDLETVSMLLTSMSNFNKYCARVATALSGAQLNYATMQITLQQTFYPGINPANFRAMQGLNALTAIIGIATAWLGPVGWAVGSASANTFKEVFSSVARGLSSTITASDMSLELLSNRGAEAYALFNTTLTQLELEHNSLLGSGGSHATQGSLAELFSGGAWVNYHDISVLNSDTLEADVRNYYSNMIFAMMINKGWLEQGAYIISKVMPQAECDAMDTGDVEKLCWNGRGYWLARYQRGVQLTSPAGASKLSETIQITAQEAMKSSIEAFESGGYKYDPSILLEQNVLTIDPTANWQAGARLRGVFNIPVCEFESTAQVGEFLDGDFIGWILERFNGGGLQGLGACVCASAKDHQGVPISESQSHGETSFKNLTASWTQGCTMDWNVDSEIMTT